MKKGISEINDNELLSRHCRLPGNFPLPFIILRALILDLPLQYISVLGYGWAKFETSYSFNPLQDDKILDIQFKTNCGQDFKVHLKCKISAIQGRKHC